MSFRLIICELYLGKTNFKYQFTGFAILGCLAVIYILYVNRFSMPFPTVTGSYIGFLVAN